MVLAYMFWSEPSNHTRLRNVVACARSTLQWHQEQNHKLRSLSAWGPFALAHVGGGFMQSMVECFRPLASQDALRSCQFELPGAGMWSHPRSEVGLADELELASTMFNLVLALVGCRLKRLSWLIRGWPGQSALFLGSAEQQQRCGQVLLADLAAWQHRKEHCQDSKALSAIVDRSCMNDVSVEQLVACFQQEGCVVTARFARWCSQSWEGVAGSQVVEDCFQRCTGMMKKSSNLRAREKRVFSHLIESTVLEGSHNYDLARSSSKGVHNRSARVGPEVFAPKMREPSIPEMSKIIGFEDKVKWYSPGPHTIPQRYTDLVILRSVFEGRIRPQELGNLWLSSLLKHKHRLLVRRFVDGAFVGGWAFALMDVADSVALVWPAQEVSAGGTSNSELFLEPSRSVKSLEECLMPVTSLVDLKAALGPCMRIQ